MSDYIVTGGTGFLGRNLIKHLNSDNNRIYAIVRRESRKLDLLPKGDNIIPVYSDLTNLSDIAFSLPKTPDSVFHFAWGGVNRDEINDPAVQDKNVKLSLDLLKMSTELGSKCFVFAGSRSEYGRQTGFYTENMECNPQVAYGRAKLEFGRMASSICKDSPMTYIHPRIFSVYGPDDHPWSLVYSSIRKMLNGEDIDLSECKHSWNFMYVTDAIDLIVTMSQKHDRVTDDNHVFNVATRDIRPLKKFVEEMKSITCSNSKLNFGAYKQPAESAVSLLPDMDKVEKFFGWKPEVTFEEGIRKIVLAMGENNA